METKREWTTIKEYEEILFDFYNGIARITINRERYRNAFTPTTTTEMSDAFYICRERPDINVVVLTGAGDTAFCAGGDMNVKADPLSPETRHRGREWFRYRRRTRIARGLRPYDRFRERYLRTDWSSCG